jgi:hypothetical protein
MVFAKAFGVVHAVVFLGLPLGDRLDNKLNELSGLGKHFWGWWVLMKG